MTKMFRSGVQEIYPVLKSIECFLVKCLETKKLTARFGG